MAKIGRPTRYSVQIAGDLPAMFENGESVAEVCKELQIGRTTFYRWVETYPKFKRAYEEGLFISEAWWVRLGRLGAAGVQKQANATFWIFNMKNRFKWRDRPDPEQVTDDEMTPEEFARRASITLAEMEDLDHGGDGQGVFAHIEMDEPPTTH